MNVATHEGGVGLGDDLLVLEVREKGLCLLVDVRVEQDLVHSGN